MHDNKHIAQTSRNELRRGRRKRSPYENRELELMDEQVYLSHTHLSVLA